MPQAIKKSAEERMEKALGALKRDLQTLRAGRASAAMIDRVEADYYGTPTPINQMGSISTPDSRTLIIQPWDKTALALIEKAILKSDLGLTPANDGTIIRINIPPLTQERRADLAKSTKKFGEEAKVAIRNIRRDANDDIKKTYRRLRTATSPKWTKFCSPKRKRSWKCKRPPSNPSDRWGLFSFVRGLEQCAP
jgi:ribosome recycling factor